jgi:hypothetical protein
MALGLVACAWVAGLPSDYAMIPADSGTDGDASPETDSASSIDASMETTPDGAIGAESGPQVNCQGAWVDASDCANCPDRYLCTDKSRRDCVADCTSCNTMWAACVLCAGGAMPFGFCKPFDTDGVLRCGIPSGDRCACDGGSTDSCPVLGEACIASDDAGTYACSTCGEPNTVGEYCKHNPQNGATCQSDGTCQ